MRPVHEPIVGLFGIVRNAALDELRRRSRTDALVSEPEDSSAICPADEVDRSST